MSNSALPATWPVWPACSIDDQLLSAATALNLGSRRRGRVNATLKQRPDVKAKRPLPDLESGDRVVARNNLGGFLRASVPRGTLGIVTVRAPDGTLTVQFDNGRELSLDPADVTTTSTGHSA